MSAIDWSSKLPADAKAENYEKGNVEQLGGPPPVRFVPELEKRSATRTATFQLKLGTGKSEHSKFESGMCEDALLHIIKFKQLSKKLAHAAKFTAARAKQRAADERLAKSDLAHIADDRKNVERRAAAAANPEDAAGGLSDDVSVSSGKMSDEARDKVIEEIRLEKLAAFEACEGMWQLWEDLLGEVLVANWLEIVEKVTLSEHYIDSSGKRKLGPRGRTFAAFDACLREWLLQKVCEPNAADRLRYYLQQQVRMPVKGCPVETFVARLLQVNKFLELLPCRKEIEGSASGIRRASKPLNEQELIDAVLSAIPHKLGVAYWAKVGIKFFPNTVQELLDEMLNVEQSYRQTSALLARVDRLGAQGQRKYQGEQNGSQNQGDKIPGGRIPKKVGFCGNTSNGSHGANHNPKKHGNSKQQKLCQNCAKWSPQWMHTHNTKDCRKWDETGKPLDRQAKNIHAHGKQNAVVMECFQQMRKDNLKLVQALTKKRKRSRKNKKRRANDSDSSDSDSE